MMTRHTSIPNNDCNIEKEHDNRYDYAESLHIPAHGDIVDDSTIRTLKRSNVTKAIANPSLTTVRSERNHAPVVAIRNANRNAIVVNQATETLIETVNRSFITAGSDHYVHLRILIISLVDAAAICLSPAVNRQARMSLHVQYIQDTVADWYSVEGANDTFFPVDNGIIEEAIQETMNQQAYTRRLQQPTSNKPNNDTCTKNHHFK